MSNADRLRQELNAVRLEKAQLQDMVLDLQNQIQHGHDALSNVVPVDVMSKWITHRPPTEEDAGPGGIVWTTYNGKTVPWSYDGVAEGTPWMPVIKPEPYVKRKLQRYIVVQGKLDDRFLELEECEAEFDSAVCMSDDVKHLEATNAELLEALEEIITQTDGRNNYVIGQDRAYAIARAAIAKAKGEGV